MTKISDLLEAVDLFDIKKQKVFLGGTCNESTWRDDLIPLLTNIDYYNPVVPDWTPSCQQEELKQRKECTYCLYVLTPKMQGIYSVAEVVDDSNKRPDKTLLCVLEVDGNDLFSVGQLKSFEALKSLVKANGSLVFDSLKSIAEYLNRGTV